MKMKLKLVIEFDTPERNRKNLERDLKKAVVSAVGSEFFAMNFSLTQLKTSVKHVDLPNPLAEELKI